MNDLDELMSRDPLELSKADLDAIIDYHRKQRARRMAGEKVSKPASASIDISHITESLVKAAKPVEAIKRRI